MKSKYWIVHLLHVHFNVLLYVYKGLNEHASVYICDMIGIYKPAKPLRFGSQCMVLVPKLEQRGMSVEKISYAAATLLDDLHSIDLNRVETVSAFQSGLKTCFFKQYSYTKKLSLLISMCCVHCIIVLLPL